MSYNALFGGLGSVCVQQMYKPKYTLCTQYHHVYCTMCIHVHIYRSYHIPVKRILYTHD